MLIVGLSILLVSLPGFGVLSEDLSVDVVAAMLVDLGADAGLENLDNRGMLLINCENGIDSCDMVKDKEREAEAIEWDEDGK
jgi:hypothetical protein